MRHDSALKLAVRLVEYLRPACRRIEIAGSVRRGKPEVKDIEIVAIPDLSPVARPRAEFGKPAPKVYKTKLDALLDEKVCSREIFMQKEGDRYKKFLIIDTQISVDLFLVLPPAQWGVQFLIRTGPADFSQWMVTKQIKGGALPDDFYVQDGSVWMAGTDTPVAVADERDYFKLCGMEYIDPHFRTPNWHGRRR